MNGRTAHEWEQALAAYTDACDTAGMNSATTTLRVRSVRAFAKPLDVLPWSMTEEVLQARLLQLPPSPYRTALRSFYRWATRSKHIASDPTTEPSRVPVAAPASASWESALSLFQDAQRAANYNESTVDLRVRNVRIFALEVDCGPWQPTWEAYRARLDSIPVSASTRLIYRTALRAFYRWAVKTNRVEANPTEEPSLRAEQLRASPAWEKELLAYGRHLRAIGRSEHSVRVRRSQLRRLAREIPHLPPYDVTTDGLLDLLATFRWEPETRHGHASALRSFYKWAKSVKRTKRDPAKHLPPVRLSHKIIEPASNDDYRVALAKAEPRERLALQLACELGLRRTEVCEIRLRDITGTPGAWWLLVHGKGSKQRRVPLSDELAGALRARGTDFAFPGNYDGHVSPNYLGKRIAELLPAGVTMHKLRHRFATDAYAVNRDVFTLQLVLGHASPATTRRYVRTPDEDMRQLVESVKAAR